MCVKKNSYYSQWESKGVQDMIFLHCSIVRDLVFFSPFYLGSEPRFSKCFIQKASFAEHHKRAFNEDTSQDSGSLIR